MLRAFLRSSVIYVIAFVNGAVVMSLELLGTRVVGIDFGSSIITWSCVISVFLGGLSAGYFCGGRVADRWNSFTGLALLLAVPMVVLLALPSYAREVSDFFYVRFWDSEPPSKWGPLLASTTLFAVPTFFLGTVSPYAVRLLVRDARRVGRGAGSVYAISTVGSILGTLYTSFRMVLWPMGVSRSMMVLGAVMFGLAYLALIGRLLEPMPGEPGHRES